MKICMVAPVPPPYGGIGNWVLLMDEFVRDKENVEFVHVNTAPKSRGLDGRSLWDRVVVQGFSMFGKKNELKHILKKEKIDAIHITTSGQLAVIRDTMLLKAAKKGKTPTVYHIRFGRIPEIAQANTREWRMIKKAMEVASCVIAIDTKTLAAIKKYAPDVNVCYIPNPFDLAKLERAGIKAELPLRKELVFVGWVIKTKGIEELLEAWECVKDTYPEWKLRIIGPYAEDYYKELSSRFSFDRVIFDGEKKHDEAMTLLAGAEGFILPSYTEGFPNAVLEAMALEKPIIATNVGAIPDMLENGCGIVIPAKDTEALKEALEHLLSNDKERQTMSKNARAKLESDYTVETVFGEYEKIWSALSQANRGST
ncbi:MAG: glycosyltransferase family 4 protein [Ruminococcaceae bacterium]|nr:glycosyltransferase family 4 protein [Oscillospiraceae bacterium]